MRRREFLTSLFSGTAVGAPFFSGGGSPPTLSGSPQQSDQVLAARCEHLLLQVQEANRRFAEANQQLRQVYYNVHQMNNAVNIVAIAEDIAWSTTDGRLSSEGRRDLDVGWKHVCRLLTAVFDDAKAWQKRVSAYLVS
jgi:hypothetical protein